MNPKSKRLPERIPKRIEDQAGGQYDAKLLFRTLKTVLRERKVSYRQLATRVSFSEGTIKNMFHFEDGPVHRVFEITQAIGLPFPDLVAAAYAQNTREFSCTREQEVFFAEHPGHYNFFRDIFFLKRTPEEVGREHGLSERSVNRYLHDLESIGLLERHLHDRLTFKVSGRLRWSHGGPWMQKHFRTYSRKITDFVLEHPKEKGVFCSFSFATLSEANRELFALELEQVVEKYKDIAYKEYVVGGDRKRLPATWMFSMVPVDIVAHREDIPELK